MSDRFRGLSVIVVGGASGIGAASAEWFAERSCNVFAADIDGSSFERASATSEKITFIQADACREADVEMVVDRVTSTTGKIDVVVYSAGIEVAGLIPTIDEKDWDRCLGVNLKGAYLFAKHVVPVMAKGSGGTIVHVASNAGLLPRFADPVYSVSKAAIIALTRSLALCHAEDRVRVNAICPGPVDGTRMMQANFDHSPDPEKRRREIISACPVAKSEGRMASTREIADAIGFLTDPGSPFLTGAILAIDGGKSLGVPGYYKPADLA